MTSAIHASKYLDCRVGALWAHHGIHILHYQSLAGECRWLIRSETWLMIGDRSDCPSRYLLGDRMLGVSLFIPLPSAD